VFKNVVELAFLVKHVVDLLKDFFLSTQQYHHKDYLENKWNSISQ